MGWRPVLVFSRVENWDWDVRAIGRHDKISWRMIRKVRPGFSHEEILLDGTAQSVKNEETPRDRSERPDIDSREEARASTIRHWKRWSRIGVVSGIKIIRKQGEWSSAKKTEKDFECYRKWWKTFYDLGNVYGCNNGISSFHGKELLEQLSLHCEHDRSHTQTNVRHIYEIGVWARWDLRIGTLVGRIIHGNTCH